MNLFQYKYNKNFDSVEQINVHKVYFNCIRKKLYTYIVSSLYNIYKTKNILYDKSWTIFGTI